MPESPPYADSRAGVIRGVSNRPTPSRYRLKLLQTIVRVPAEQGSFDSAQDDRENAASTAAALVAAALAAQAFHTFAGNQGNHNEGGDGVGPPPA